MTSRQCLRTHETDGICSAGDEEIMKIIKVKCLNGFKEYKRNTFCAEAMEGTEYIAELYEESEEYFAKDDNGHEFLVGELLFNGTLKIGEDFKLIT